MRQNKILRNIILGIENLWLHKLRSFLTMIGVVFGVGSVVAMLSVGEGASKEALDQIRKLGSNNIIISSVKSVKDESISTTRTFMSMYGLTYNDHLRMAETFDTIKCTAPVKLLRKEARLGEKSLELRVVGTTSTWFKLVERPIVAGRVLLPSDENDQMPVTVLTEFGARKILATENIIGQSLRIGGEYFEVVGIIKSESGEVGAIQIPDQEIDAYIPLSIAQSYFGDSSLLISSGSFSFERVELHQIIIAVISIEDVETTAIGIESMLHDSHKKKDYLISVPLSLLKQAETTKRRFNIVLGSIACISLLVGGIGIMNIMLASVTERIREIGIRRAIGAKRKQIIYQFLVETVVLSTIGGILGIGLGAFIPLVITFFTKMPTVITWGSIVFPLFISISIGIIFGLYPAYSASRVDPIIALRHE